MKENMFYVCNNSDLKDGQMKSFSVEGQQILIIRQGEEFSALGAVCPHHGAPLEEGVLAADQIICPWHHAVFNAANGDNIIPPALERLPKYKTDIKNNRIYVTFPPATAELSSDKKLFPDSTFVIAGTGAAGTIAAKTLRKNGFAGQLILITNSDRKPYDRTTLSKSYLTNDFTPDDLKLLPDSFFDEKTRLITNSEINAIDTIQHRIHYDGSDIVYDKLLLATGSSPKRLDIDGSDLENIFSLRTLSDAEKIIDAAEESANAVIVGAGFISLEIAGRLAQKGVNVKVVAPEDIPFERILGKEIGTELMKQHKQNGIEFHLGTKPARYYGNDNVQGIELKNGKKVKADFIIEAVGVKPNTSFAHLLTNDFDRISVDDYMNAEDSIYAAGDIAAFIYKRTGKRIHIEHWRTAQQQGKLAALNMLGKNIKQHIIPFFWTSQQGIILQSAGITSDADEIIIDGNIKNHDFIAFYIQHNMVVGVAGIGRDSEIAKSEALLRNDSMPGVEKIRDNAYSLIA